MLPLQSYPGSLRLRLKRKGGAVTVEYQAGDGAWIMFRTAYLSTAHELEVGRMAAAPDGPGFEVEAFSEFRMERLNS